MQNAQNTEIQQRVINLVELYRTKVGKESEAAQMVRQESDSCLFGLVDIEDVVDCDKVRVDEQLVGHFYYQLAGKEADESVQSGLLHEHPHYYDESVFTEEEELFLKDHFKEMVNYVVEKPFNEFNGIGISGSGVRNAFHIPTEILELIKRRFSIPAGSTVYCPFSGMAQFTSLFPNCSFLCEDGYLSYDKRWNDFCDWSREHSNSVHDKHDERIVSAWMNIVLFANGTDATIIKNNEEPETFDAVFSYLPVIPYAIPNHPDGIYLDENGCFIPEIPADQEIIDKIHLSYSRLSAGGKMMLILPTEHVWNDFSSSLDAFWKQVCSEKSLVEIIQTKNVMWENSYENEYCIVIIEKGRKRGVTTLIDARFAVMSAEKKESKMFFNLDAFDRMLKNEGREMETGLQKMVCIPTSELRKSLLIPEYYVIDRPSEHEMPVSLASLCQLVTDRVKSVAFDLPLTTPWIRERDFSTAFHSNIDLSKIETADCPNNPPHTEDYDFDRYGNFIDDEMHYHWNKNTSEKSLRAAEYRNCFYIDGSYDVVVFSLKNMKPSTAIVRSSQRPIAVSDGNILVFRPVGIDALELAAILTMPIVYRQIMTYKELGLYGDRSHLRDIYVPTDKRIIYDEIQRLENEEFLVSFFENRFAAMKVDYINEVRMRKHDMGQKVFDLVNTEDLIRYYVENRETEEDSWSQIEEQLNHLRYTIHELSEMLDKFSQEEHFGTPELLDLDVYFNSLQHSKDINGYKLSFQLDRDSLLKIQSFRMGVKDAKTFNDDSVRPLVFIAKNDIYRVVSNILNNAQRHGFVDTDRKDYEVNIRLRFDSEKQMYQIDFRNNGQPLPEGMDKMRYGIKGEKAGQTAGTGIGGNVVKSIVEHYNGNYDVFMEEGWTVVRIYLPKYI